MVGLCRETQSTNECIVLVARGIFEFAASDIRGPCMENLVNEARLRARTVSRHWLWTVTKACMVVHPCWHAMRAPRRPCARWGPEDRHWPPEVRRIRLAAVRRQRVLAPSVLSLRASVALTPGLLRALALCSEQRLRYGV